MKEYKDVEKMLINKTKITILKVVDIMENVALSFSGGKDSTVLKWIIDDMYKNGELLEKIPSIFCDTGVEYNKIVNFVKSEHPDTKIIKPKQSFWKIVEVNGYPAISKEQSQYLHEIRTTKSDKLREKRLNIGNSYAISKKWKFIIDEDIKISHRCCYNLKKAPLRKLGYYYFTGERIEESSLRKQQLKTCFTEKKSTPLRLWSDELIDKFIENNNIKICDIYKYEERTGCKFCMFGIQFEKGIDKIDRLKELEPESYKICKIKGVLELKERIKNAK